MAKEDYNVADRVVTSLTAGDKVQETVQVTPDADAAAAARAAGVSNAAFVDYEEALEAHQSRPDIETLGDRRAREYGADFDVGSFMRQAAYDADGTAADAPRPGTIYGDVPASS